jgi:tRNA/rRNA methyltransferase
VIVSDRAARQAWLQERGYRVLAMRADDVISDIAAELDRLEALLASGMPGQGDN